MPRSGTASSNPGGLAPLLSAYNKISASTKDSISAKAVSTLLLLMCQDSCSHSSRGLLLAPLPVRLSGFLLLFLVIPNAIVIAFCGQALSHPLPLDSFLCNCWPCFGNSKSFVLALPKIIKYFNY